MNKKTHPNSMICILIVFLFASLALTGCDTDDLETAKSIQVAGCTRHYLEHVPLGLDESTPVPLVIDIHGFGGTANSQRENSGFKEIADEEGFIVVYPIGNIFFESEEGIVKKERMQSFNAGLTCCGRSVTDDIDDVGFIAELIEKIKLEYNIDETRIYATGMSNGGALAQRLAVEVPYTFAAIVSYAQYLLTEGPHTLEQPIPVMEIHGLNDKFCIYNQCDTCGNPNKYGFPGAEANRDHWGELNGCQTFIESERVKGGHRGKDKITSWVDCDGDVKVKLVSLNCGHLKIYDYRKRTVDVTQIGWDFMKQYTLPH